MPRTRGNNILLEAFQSTRISSGSKAGNKSAARIRILSAFVQLNERVENPLPYISETEFLAKIYSPVSFATRQFVAVVLPVAPLKMDW